jgi:hypothetical protein
MPGGVATDGAAHIYVSCVEERRKSRRATALLAISLAVAAVALTACGSGGDKQDANEPSGDYKLDVISASFPGRQRLGESTQLRIQVKNQSGKTIPNLAISIEGFSQHVEDPTLSTPSRNIWLINQAPFNSDSSFTNTWTLGAVPDGAIRTATWKVTAVRTGTYSVRYRVAAGTDGKAKAQLPDRTPPRGSFIAHIAREPRKTTAG